MRVAIRRNALSNPAKSTVLKIFDIIHFHIIVFCSDFASWRHNENCIYDLILHFLLPFYIISDVSNSLVYIIRRYLNILLTTLYLIFLIIQWQLKTQD